MAPNDIALNQNTMNFELVCSLNANNAIPVYKYKSVKTGLTVFIAEVDGPVVDGYFCLATEAFDDDGLPHTLEHLVFLGSENYPYKGILDLWANRCFASGTNAFTDQDHTNYTMTTAGSEGFLSLMPIYLEHILYPTLLDSAFLTEVHHITGTGEDAGVVYCEMQGTENTGERLAYVELCRSVYPGHCGYKSVTGGAIKNLQESTTNEKVKKYHQEFYRPENLTIVITGKVNHSQVFRALQPLEEKIISKGDRGPFTRPWQNPVEPLEESVNVKVYYPCDDEDNGIVNVGWRGPPATTEIYNISGCFLLLKYLCDTSVSPLQREFVEHDDPYASNVAYSLAENSVSLIFLMFESVPKDKIPLVKDRLLSSLSNVYKDENGIDMARMKTVIQRHLLEMLSNLENNPHCAIAQMLFGDILYGRTEEDLYQRLNQIEILTKLSSEPKSYWLHLLQTYLIDAPVVCIMGIPSIEKQRELAQNEKERITRQIERLGKNGLERKEKELQEAISENEKPIPPELLSAVPIPRVESINFHPMKSYTTDTLDQHTNFDVTKIPLYTYLDHVNTNFIYLFIIMDTSMIPRELRPYIPILLEALTESPIKRNGEIISYEDVVAELEADTVGVDISLGLEDSARFSCGVFSHSVKLLLQLELQKYEKGIQWIRELLYDTILTVERLKIIAAKIINDVAQCKRNGNKVDGDLMKGLIYNKNSNHYAASMLRQQKFLTKMLERFAIEEGQKEVIADIESVRKTMTSFENMVLYIAVNVDKLATEVSDIYTPWARQFADKKPIKKKKLYVTNDWALTNSIEDIPIKGCVTGLGCVDSAFLSQCCACIKDFLHPDLAPLLVCLQYLTQVEGPMWRLIRGQGLSYSYNIYVMPHEGLLYLSLFKATNVIAAYKEAKLIVETHLKESKWEKLLYESAKSSLIFTMIDKEKSVGDMVVQSLLSYFKNVSNDYNYKMVRRISDVTLEDVKFVASKYLAPLFDPKQCITTAVCHPSKAPEVLSFFKALGHDLKLYNSLEETFLNE